VSNGNGESGEIEIMRSPSGKTTINTKALAALIAFLTAGGYMGGVSLHPTTAAADHDQVTTLSAEVKSIKESMVLISNRLDRLDDNSSETKELVKRLVYGRNRDSAEVKQ
jgi:hypothetical protein